MQRRASVLPATARRPQRAAMWYIANVFDVHKTLFKRTLRVSGDLLACTFMRTYAFNIYTQLLWRLHCALKICVALVQRSPRTSNECWRTTDARQTLWQKNQLSVRGSCVDYVWLNQGWGQIHKVKYKYEYEVLKNIKYKCKYKYVSLKIFKYKYKYKYTCSNTNKITIH